jgi:hypothetical protein
MRTIKTYLKGAPFYNACNRLYNNYFRVARLNEAASRQTLSRV